MLLKQIHAWVDPNDWPPVTTAGPCHPLPGEGLSWSESRGRPLLLLRAGVCTQRPRRLDSEVRHHYFDPRSVIAWH